MVALNVMGSARGHDPYRVLPPVTGTRVDTGARLLPGFISGNWYQGRHGGTTPTGFCNR